MSVSPLILTELSAFENRLRQGGYTQLEPFFVLREGTIQDERTGGQVHLDRKRLQAIADTQNNRIATTGDATPIIIGHTKRNKFESEQPKLTGWATRFEVAPFFNTGKYGVRAIPWSKPENINKFDEYPRRSAELWTDPDLIDPISLLGANTPRLDLGPHRLQLEETREYLPRQPLILEMTMPEDVTAGSSASPATPDAKNDSGFANSPEWQQTQQQLSQLMDMMNTLKPLLDELKAGGVGDAPGLDAPGGAPPMPGSAPPGGGPGLDAPGGAPPMPPTGQPQQMSACPPGSSNAAMPHMLSRQQQQQYEQTLQFAYGGQPMLPTQYGYTQPQLQQQQPIQLQQGVDPRDRQIAAMGQQIAALQLARMEDSVNGLLDDLETKIVIDRARDKDKLIRLSKAELDSEIQFMLATRKQIEEPVPTFGVPLQMQADGTTGPRTAGPMQMSLQDVSAGYAMGADPRVAKIAGPQSHYDKLQEIVRNRGKLDPMDAYAAAMGPAPGANGTVKVR